MPQYKAKYLENLDTHIEVEPPISLYDFVRIIAEHNNQPMSKVCIEILGCAQFNEHWFAGQKKGRPYDSRYATRRKKQVKDEAETTSIDRERLEKLVTICDLLGIDINTSQAHQTQLCSF